MNRAIRYIPYVLSQTAGAPGKSTGKGGEEPGGASEYHQRRKAALGRAAGQEAYMGMMILALSMRHSVERPATRMGGDTKDLWSDLSTAV